MHHALLIGLLALGGNLLQAAAHRRKLLDHSREILALNAHQFYVIQRRAASPCARPPPSKPISPK